MTITHCHTFRVDHFLLLLFVLNDILPASKDRYIFMYKKNDEANQMAANKKLKLAPMSG